MKELSTIFCTKITRLVHFSLIFIAKTGPMGMGVRTTTVTVFYFIVLIVAVTVLLFE